MPSCPQEGSVAGVWSAWADLLPCGASVLTTQYKGCSRAIDALCSGPPITPQAGQGEHHLLLVSHGSMMHGRACSMTSSIGTQHNVAATLETQIE